MPRIVTHQGNRTECYCITHKLYNYIKGNYDNEHSYCKLSMTQVYHNLHCEQRAEILTGSLLKKTSDVRVRMNQRFFHDFHPIPKIL